MVRKKSIKQKRQKSPKQKKQKKLKNEKILKNKTFKKNWNKSICHPKQKNKQSCLTSVVLKKLKDKWNIRKPNDTIKTYNPKKIWEFFKNRYSNSCDNEKC